MLAVGLVLLNAHGFITHEPPTAPEASIARGLRSAALPSKARTGTNPVPNTPEVFVEARAHWADHSAICHANDGFGDRFIGKHTYPPAPDMRLHFIRHLPQLTAAQKKEMEKEAEEERFLKGEDVNDQPIKHHHH